MGKTARRRWFQFRLRTLLIAVLVLSLPLSWFAGQLERARKEREAVKIIEDAGGEVTICRCAELPDRQWMPRFWRDIFLVHVRRVSLSTDVHLPAPGRGATKFGDDEAAYLKRLDNLVGLYLTDTQVTDTGLEHLRGLSKLTDVSVMNTKVTPEGVNKLQEALPNCKIKY